MTQFSLYGFYSTSFFNFLNYRQLNLRLNFQGIRNKYWVITSWLVWCLWCRETFPSIPWVAPEAVIAGAETGKNRISECSCRSRRPKQLAPTSPTSYFVAQQPDLNKFKITQVKLTFYIATIALWQLCFIKTQNIESQRKQGKKFSWRGKSSSTRMKTTQPQRN